MHPGMGKHDQLFKDTFRDPARAAGELRSVLPKKILDAIDLKTLTRVPGDTVSRPQRNERFADALFKADFKAGGTGFIWLLLEHQSEPDRWMLVRALEQAGRVLGAWVRKNSHAALLPPFICLVVHHGERGWKSGRLHDLVAGLKEVPALKRYVPDFELLVDDLAQVPDAQLRRRPLDALAHAVLWALRDARNSARMKKMSRARARMFERLSAAAPQDADVVLEYILDVAGDESLNSFLRLLSEAAPTTETKMLTIRQAAEKQGREQGLRLGVKRGKAKGRVEGKAEDVLAVLEARGLAVTAEQRELVLACQDVRTLDRWLRKAATARKAATLFVD